MYCNIFDFTIDFLCYSIIILIIYKLISKTLKLKIIDDIPSRYVLVTGCDSGFGQAFAKRLDKLGCHVFAACYTEKGEDELRKSTSKNVCTFRLDISDHQSILDAYAFVSEKLPKGKGLWGLVNNAATAFNFGLADWFSVQDYQDHLNVNTLGTIDMTTTFLPLVKKAEGRVVNTSSAIALVPIPGFLPYTISKYALEGFSDDLRRHLQFLHFNVSVHLVEPLAFETRPTDTHFMHLPFFQQTFARCSQQIKDTYGENYGTELMNFHKRMLESTASKDLSPVLDAYEHALFGCYPQSRYVVGRGATFLKILAVLPAGISDWFCKQRFKDLPLPLACRK